MRKRQTSRAPDLEAVRGVAQEVVISIPYDGPAGTRTTVETGAVCLRLWSVDRVVFSFCSYPGICRDALLA